jgi:hypothetical protein
MIEDYLMFIFLNNPNTLSNLRENKWNYQPKAEPVGVAVDLYSEAAVPTDALILIKSD